jgi:hypothetical protein
MSPKTNFLFVVSNQPWPIYSTFDLNRLIHDYLPTVLCLEDCIKSRNDTTCEWWGLIALSSTLSLDYGKTETFSIVLLEFTCTLSSVMDPLKLASLSSRVALLFKLFFI